MVLYRYIKEKKSVKRMVLNKISYLALIGGSLLLFWSFYPILSFEIYSRFFIQNQVASPISKSEFTLPVKDAKSVLGSFNVFSSNLRDFTQVNFWFPDRPQVIAAQINLKTYALSIPKLNITKAKVIVGGEDLTKSLVHYLPTSLPGEYGNVVIFGHSTLPQLYNTKDYKTIFTYLPSLDKGDKLITHANGVDYEYEVFDMFVVEPDQVSVLEQKYDASYITLITCVPPGTYWKRLVVRAKLTKLPT